MKYKVIDNFLDKEYFDRLVTFFIGDGIPWYFTETVADHVENNLFYMTHLFYIANLPKSEYYNIIVPLLEKLDTKCLIRVKANFYPNTERLHEHPKHVDYPYSHSGAILSLNTCDGYTKLKDGTKIDSIANRVLLFDSSEEHGSTTTTNVNARINLNINYIQEQLYG